MQQVDHLPLGCLTQPGSAPACARPYLGTYRNACTSAKSDRQLRRDIWQMIVDDHHFFLTDRAHAQFLLDRDGTQSAHGKKLERIVQ